MEKKRMIKIMNETTQLSATWMCLVWWFYKHIGYDSWRKWLDKTRTHTSTRTPEQTLLEYSNDEFIIKTSHIHICVGIQHMACSIDRVYIYIYIYCLWIISHWYVWDCVKFVWSRSVFFFFFQFHVRANDSNYCILVYNFDRAAVIIFVLFSRATEFSLSLISLNLL